MNEEEGFFRKGQVSFSSTCIFFFTEECSNVWWIMSLAMKLVSSLWCMWSAVKCVCLVAWLFYTLVYRFSELLTLLSYTTPYNQSVSILPADGRGQYDDFASFSGHIYQWWWRVYMMPPEDGDLWHTTQKLRAFSGLTKRQENDIPRMESLTTIHHHYGWGFCDVVFW